MTSWFGKGRPALQEALQRICDEIDADITAGTCFSLLHRAVGTVY